MTDSPTKTTSALGVQNGWDKTLDERLPAVFEDLRRLAELYFAREPADDPGSQQHTHQPTALVGEVYLRLVGSKPQPLRNRKQFFAFATRLIREILLDQARAGRTVQRGGILAGASSDEALGRPTPADASPETLLAIDQALKRLEQIDPCQSQVVELCYFGGLTLGQAAEVLGIPGATAERDRSAARRWLARDMQL